MCVSAEVTVARLFVMLVGAARRRLMQKGEVGPYAPTIAKWFATDKEAESLNEVQSQINHIVVNTS